HRSRKTCWPRRKRKPSWSRMPGRGSASGVVSTGSEKGDGVPGGDDTGDATGSLARRGTPAAVRAAGGGTYHTLGAAARVTRDRADTRGVDGANSLSASVRPAFLLLPFAFFGCDSDEPTPPVSAYVEA